MLKEMPGWLAALLFALLAIFLVHFAEITPYASMSGLLMIGGIIAGFFLLTKL